MMQRRALAVAAIAMLAAHDAEAGAPRCQRCGKPVGSGRLDQQFHATGRCSEIIDELATELERRQSALGEQRLAQDLRQQRARDAAKRDESDARRRVELARSASLRTTRIDRAKAKRDRKRQRRVQ